MNQAHDADALGADRFTALPLAEQIFGPLTDRIASPAAPTEAPISIHVEINVGDVLHQCATRDNALDYLARVAEIFGPLAKPT